MQEINKHTIPQNENIYLKKIKIDNYGSIEKFEHHLQFDEKGNPLPLVLVGKNGSGKTLLLSNILHSIIEIKRQLYSEIPEVNGDNYYRVSSKNYIQKGKDFSYIGLEFTNGMHHASAMINNPNIFNFSKIENYKHIDIKNEGIRTNGFFYNSSICKKESFDRNVFLYFPVDRYYVPMWLNAENEKLSFLITQNFIGVNKNDIVKDNLLTDIETWILDVIIDKYIYEDRIVYKNNQNNNTQHIYDGKNTQILAQINRIINKIFPNCEKYNSARIGISTKENRKISIMAKDPNGNDIQLLPSFHNLSSGEIMILSMFCSILKEADRLSNSENLNLNEISGIVLIDEIDSHLHSNFAKEILPQVMALFPKIQFIVSSHSPFYLLGMKQQFDEKCTFITMPDGSVMNDVENFEEIQKCYEMLDSNHIKIIEDLKKANEKISSLQKPLIITEGITDWMHIKNALDYYKSKGKYNELDIDFLEYKMDFGDSNLQKLLKNLAYKNNNNKIIGIFDSDDEIGRMHKELKDFGNNVFGICIPDNENYPKGISIEFLYNDDDLTKKDKHGRRLFLSNEFKEKSRRLIIDDAISTTNKKVESYYKNGFIKIIDEGVYDTNENSIALSKKEFATNILNKTPPFDEVDLSRFIPLLDKLNEIINKE